MKHVMVDIETLGIENDTVVLSIAAVQFDGNAQGESISYTCSVDDVAQQIQIWRSVSASTLAWWLKQSEEARGQVLLDKSASSPPDLTWEQFQVKLEQFLADKYVWANGPDFDIDILTNLLGYGPGSHELVPFNKRRCVRTIKELVPKTARPERTGAHVALDDCLYQIELVRDAYRRAGCLEKLNA